MESLRFPLGIAFLVASQVGKNLPPESLREAQFGYHDDFFNIIECSHLDFSRSGHMAFLQNSGGTSLIGNEAYFPKYGNNPEAPLSASIHAHPSWPSDQGPITPLRP